MPTFPPVDEQLETIRRGTDEILPLDALEKKLERSREESEPLTVKLGCDPSRPDLHLGHTVVLRKLRQFQDLGHRAVLIVGDFTGMIGDPSGRSKTRPPLTMEETRRNGQSYFDQAAKVLDSERADIRYNSDWLGEMGFDGVIRLASKYTVARMLERDDFEERYSEGAPIGVHEFLYPLAQAQDSVHIEADVELGGTDQKFNLLVGRRVQEQAGREAQVCITLPILEGIGGGEKMSKSLDNFIGISEAPEEMFGKLMSIPDDLIYRYAELVSGIPTDELSRVQAEIEKDPMAAKEQLARRVTALYHDEAAAERGAEHFNRTVRAGDTPDEMPELRPSTDGGATVGLLDLMKEAEFTTSNSEGRRLIEQGAVSIDGEAVEDTGRYIDLAQEAPFVLKVGKRRYVRVVGG
jgi:tyrosyl-tRNA synthetase